MRTREYGKTGEKISVIGFGGMRFPDPRDIDANAALVLHAYRRGINYFDTAPFYCKDKSEDIIGAAVRRMNRKRVYLSTKCMEADGAKLRKSLEKSLKRLNTSYIDFFHIWCIVNPDQWKQRKKGGAVAAAMKAKDEGLIRHLAVSSHLPGKDLGKLLAEGVFEGVTLGYCALNFPYRQKALDAAAKRHLGVITMNPLAGGLIPQHAKRFDFLRAKDDASVVDAALRFNLSQPAVTSALVGFKTAKQIDQAVAVAENFRPYPASHRAALRKKMPTVFNDLCTGCSYCLPCPVGVEVPKLMDAYNFRLLGGDHERVKRRLLWHWDLTPAATLVCTLCGACEKRCTQRLPLRTRIKYFRALAKGKKPRR